jgi:hypothetical protein
MLTILSDGWSGLETKLGHVWSVAKTANVRLMTRDVPGTLTIGLKANPLCPMAGGGHCRQRASGRLGPCG